VARQRVRGNRVCSQPYAGSNRCVRACGVAKGVWKRVRERARGSGVRCACVLRVRCTRVRVWQQRYECKSPAVGKRCVWRCCSVRAGSVRSVHAFRLYVPRYLAPVQFFPRPVRRRSPSPSSCPKCLSLLPETEVSVACCGSGRLPGCFVQEACYHLHRPPRLPSSPRASMPASTGMPRRIKAWQGRPRWEALRGWSHNSRELTVLPRDVLCSVRVAYAILRLPGRVSIFCCCSAPSPHGSSAFQPLCHAAAPVRLAAVPVGGA